ncbi:DUF1295 domain-containing protein [Marinibactrum halimedae]|uniref:Membrane protein n=1 Tax=Marinibactrum halimedae TaxID=1444977 RepID=A0AA37WL74_9GAMM|nr:DUF1295 domain-containing protein [Marinibactrum halimedae]MCD9459627.1 DUF1295 domain-containing protein [Marinibactrum halimedae]GLS25654.1 membrane protein [Marinibactrum halimedae]
MGYITPLLPYLAGWLLLMFTPPFFELGWVNGVGQLTLFAFVVCLPAWKTGRLSYVDIGWPLGLAIIGLVALLLAEGNILRQSIIGLVYVFIGLRMGLVAIKLWRLGVFQNEFPRYQYQRLRWQEKGIKNIPLMIQVEAVLQGVANMSFLAFPAFVIAVNPVSQIHMLEMFGLLIWVGAFAMETIADNQKRVFLKEMKKQGLKNQVCNVGLWRYSRHPNYFAEWMVWNALVIAALPSWWVLQAQINTVLWLLIGLGVLNASRVMYVTLVDYTGAKPAEYFSVQKRPKYKTYQQTTNQFFPGPFKSAK